MTWTKQHTSGHGNWKLRGCIGTFAAKELSAGLREYAIIAAIHDSRFPPIEKSELSQLRCDISLLTNFEKMPVGNLTDWQVGQHGIQIDFTDPVTHRHHSATYLPEVAKEQGWTQEETIEELVQKSAYSRALTPQVRAKIQLTRYQSEKESLKYEEYVALRQFHTGATHQGLLGGAASSSSASPAPPAAASKSPEENDDDDDDDISDY